MTGVRAYERRADLRANNHRLIEYVENGGTVIVQYNKMEFNQAQYGPYPPRGELGSDHRRECAGEGAGARASGVHLAEPHRRLRLAGMGQERGLYFLGDKDAKYVDLVEMEDPFEYNSGASAARWSKRATAKDDGCMSDWDCGVSCRRAPDGAYKLMANLVSLGIARSFQMNWSHFQLRRRASGNLIQHRFTSRAESSLSSMSSVSFSSRALAADSTARRRRGRR